MTSVVSPSYLKQVARKLKKEKSITQSEALDEAAKQFDFSNYKHYLNSLEEKKKNSPPSKDMLLTAIFSESDMQKKESLAITYIHNFNPAFKILFKLVSEFKNSREAIQSVCSQSGLHNEVHASLLSFFLEARNEIQGLPLMEGFVAKHISIRSLDYSFKNGLICTTGKYNLEFEFEEEVPEFQKHLPHFRRNPMFGEFEVSYDENKKEIIENPTIADEIDGRIYKSRFKLNHNK